VKRLSASGRKKKLVIVIRGLWDSLDSHLDFTHDTKKVHKYFGGERFHAKTVREYAGFIKDLSELL